MADFDEEIAAAMAVYTPPIPEPSSEGFLPLIDRPETKVVNIRDGYRSRDRTEQTGTGWQFGCPAG